MRQIKSESTERTSFIVLDQLDQGWSTRSYPHLISDRQLYVADNVLFNRDGLISKRPGSSAFGYAVSGTTGKTGSNQPSQSGARFYPVGAPPQLLVQSAGVLYGSNDLLGTISTVIGPVSSTTTARYDQVYDPDMTTGAAVAMIVVDGVNVPHLWDGVHYVPVQTAAAGGSLFLPTNPAGNPITPAFVKQWGPHTVYAGDPIDPTGIYISDALRPERFNGYGLIDSAGSTYYDYFPAGRGASGGIITGLAVVNQFLIIFYSDQIVVGFNTGTYGAYEFQFITLSSSNGNVAPNSVVEFDGYAVYFGGDGFYAINGIAITKLPDEIPSVYADTSQSAFPSEMANKSVVVGCRRGDQYWASYDNIGDGHLHSIVVFDRAAAGGWSFGAEHGGAWSRFPTGMPLAWGLECRGPGDSAFPFFWGSSLVDQIAQFDTGGYSDLGQDIAMEVRLKAFFLDNPLTVKDVQSLWIMGTFPQSTTLANYMIEANPYVITDASNPTQSIAPTITFEITNQEAIYGDGAMYGDGTLYGTAGTILTNVRKSYPQQPAIGYVFQPGVRESSSSPFNIIGMIAEVIVDPPRELSYA